MSENTFEEASTLVMVDGDVDWHATCVALVKQEMKLRELQIMILNLKHSMDRALETDVRRPHFPTFGKMFADCQRDLYRLLEAQNRLILSIAAHEGITFSKNKYVIDADQDSIKVEKVEGVADIAAHEGIKLKKLEDVAKKLEDMAEGDNNAGR